MAVVALLLLGTSWALIWSQDTFWNPLFFVGLWTGATLLMYTRGRRGYPGLLRHLALMSVSVLVWWWFELVNGRVGSWEYIHRYDYSAVEYFLLASLAFSTVVPTLHSAWRLVLSWLRPLPGSVSPRHNRAYLIEALAGAGTQVLIFSFPALFFPLVWVAPFLVLDGLVGYWGGRSLARDLCRGEWRLAAAIGLAGIICGGLWEFWNFWSTPKWIYHVGYVEFLHVFEMPILGYAGYVPFAWSIYQLLQLRPFRRYLAFQP